MPKRQLAAVLCVIAATAGTGCDQMKKLDAARDAKKREKALAQQNASMSPVVVDSSPAIPIPASVPASIGPQPVPQTTPAKPAVDLPFVTAPHELATLGANLIVPVSGVLRPHLRDTYAEPRATRVHEAIDILAPRGTNVVSATDGRLLKLFNSKAGGLMVYATDPSERFILRGDPAKSWSQGSPINPYLLLNPK